MKQSKKERLILFHREVIAQVANQLFHKQGTDKTTMDEIAQKADYSKATLYVYFKNKEEIILFNVLGFMEQLEQEMNHIVMDKRSATQQYDDIFDLLIRSYEESSLYFTAMLGSIEVGAEKRAELDIVERIYQTGERLNSAVEVLLRNGMNQKLFRVDLNPKETGLIFWFSLSGLIASTANKRPYIEEALSMKQEDFLHMGKDLLLRSIRSLEKE